MWAGGVAALLLFFHGQFGNALVTADLSDYGRLGEKHGFMTVFPQVRGAWWRVGCFDMLLIGAGGQVVIRM